MRFTTRKKQKKTYGEHRHIGVTLRIAFPEGTPGKFAQWEIPGITIYCDKTDDVAMYYVPDDMLPLGVRVSIHGVPFAHERELVYWLNEYSHEGEET